MFDTLRINLTDCDIKTTSPIVIQPAVFTHSDMKKMDEYDLFINNHGKIIRGNKAFLNHCKFNITINPSMVNDQDINSNKFKPKRFKRILPDQELWDYNYEGEDDVTGIYLQTSLPRLIHKTNIKSLSIDECKKAFEILSGHLKQSGIKTNLMNAKLSRLDTFTNIKTEHNFFSYSPLFSLMDCSRMKSVDYCDESFLWKNGQQQINIYDKIREEINKNPDFKTNQKNIMRLENRLLRKRKIISELNLQTVGELFKNYNDVKEFHKQEIGNRIFKYSFDEIHQLTENDLETKLRLFKKHFKRNYLNEYFKSFGYYTLNQQLSIEAISEVIEKIEGGNDVKVRMKKSRLFNSMRKYKFFFGAIENNSQNKTTNLELYDEIRKKFFKEVA